MLSFLETKSFHHLSLVFIYEYSHIYKMPYNSQLYIIISGGNLCERNDIMRNE